MAVDCFEELSPGAVKGVLKCRGFCVNLVEGSNNGVDRNDFICGVGVSWVVVMGKCYEFLCVCVNECVCWVWEEACHGNGGEVSKGVCLRWDWWNGVNQVNGAIECCDGLGWVKAGR